MWHLHKNRVPLVGWSIRSVYVHIKFSRISYGAIAVGLDMRPKFIFAFLATLSWFLNTFVQYLFRKPTNFPFLSLFLFYFQLTSATVLDTQQICICSKIESAQLVALKHGIKCLAMNGSLLKWWNFFQWKVTQI